VSKSDAKPDYSAAVHPEGTKYLSSIAFRPTGVGFIVGRPKQNNVSLEAKQLADGCWSWLQAEIAGTPGLEQTPPFEEIILVTNDLNLPDATFSDENIKDVLQETGSKFVACSEVSEQGETITLTYRLYNMIGAKIATETISGSNKQLIDQLPDLCKKLLTDAGLSRAYRAHLSYQSVDDALAVGQFYSADSSDKTKIISNLQKASSNCPLATALLFDSGIDSQEMETDFLSRINGNQYLLSISLGATKFVKGNLDDESAKILSENKPKSYALAFSYARRLGNLGKNELAEHYLKQAVSLNSKDSWGWCCLSKNLDERADKIREGKYYNDMSQTETKAVEDLYPKDEIAAYKACQLSPRNTHACFRLAFAATFNGDSDVAKAALWHGLDVNPEYLDLYGWGLQIFQPKWGGDQKDMIKLVKQIKQYPKVYAAKLFGIYRALDAWKEEATDPEIATLKNEAYADHLKQTTK
jgi:tetratricopeptide (TPR) repeat protein